MNHISRNSERGQTLIETLVAVFILVLGISTAIGLGTYAFRSADDSTRVIIGTSLAREGIEAVNNQRDGNWVNDSFTPVNEEGVTCTFNGGSTTQPCDPDWLTNLSSGTYALDFNGGGLKGVSGIVFTPTAQSFALRYCPPGILNVGQASGAYISSTAGAPICIGATSTVYSRQIVLQSNSTAPYNYQSSEAPGVTEPGYLSAVVTVWWTSRHCPPTTDPTTLPVSCKVILETHLTNWQNKFNSNG